MFRRKVLAALIAATLAQGVAAAEIDIEAQDMAGAIRKLGAQTGIQVIFSADELSGMKAAAVHGNMPPEAALRKLLEGCGCELSSTGTNTFVIRREGKSSKKQDTLGEVVVVAKRSIAGQGYDEAFAPLGGYRHEVNGGDRARSSDTADLLRDMSAISLRLNGGVATIPGLHGMDDDRVKVLVDGMTITSACSNHMNTPLSYVTAENIDKITAMAGITPVSLGGDSIGGTISVETAPPQFASLGEKKLGGRVGAYFRSVDQGVGASLALNAATDNLSLTYSGAYDSADSYRRGNGGPRVLATLYQSNTHNLGLAARTSGGDVLSFYLGYEKIPKQGFVNQRMDMVNNEGVLANLGYSGNYSWGSLEGRLYHHHTRHQMDMLPLPERGGSMPMSTRGKDSGYRLRAQIPLADRNTLRIGNEYHQFRLQDWYPAFLSPWGQTLDFLSINGGKRDRMGTFAEWQTDWNPAWMTLFGLRNDTVRMDTGNVQSYWDQLFGPNADAVAFNAIGHARRDSNWDATVLARYKPNESSTYEFGLAQKTRSPNLYERYSWMMYNSMINTVGDHNGWYGDPNLKPEVAHTLSVTGEWRSPDHAGRYLRIAPYVTSVKDYIDGRKEVFWMPWEPTAGLRYINVSRAELYGVDMNAAYDISSNWNLRGMLGYTHGTNRANGEPLYNIMPLHGQVAVEPSFGVLKGAVELDMAARKSRVSPAHVELATAGYALLNLRASYDMKPFRIDAGIENALDKLYYLPLGGVNDPESALTYGNQPGVTARNFAVPGKGRSLYLGVSAQF